MSTLRCPCLFFFSFFSFFLLFFFLFSFFFLASYTIVDNCPTISDVGKSLGIHIHGREKRNLCATRSHEVKMLELGYGYA